MTYKHENIINSISLPFKAFKFHASDISRMVAPHWHESIEINYVIDGSLIMKVADHLVTISKGHAMLVNTNYIHSSRSPEPNHVLVIQIPLDYLLELTNGEYGNRFIFHIDPNANLSPELSNDLNRFANNLKRQMTLSEKLDTMSTMISIVKDLVNNYQVPFSLRLNEDSNLVKKVLQYVDEYHRKNISLNDIAQKLGYSLPYCSKIIKINLGVNFLTLIINARLNDACVLLTTTKLDLESIAQNSGFDNYRNMYNWFKKSFNISPGEYRKKYHLY